MNLLFLTLLDFDNLDEHNIYTDLLRKFHKEGHNVYVISPVERKKNKDTKYDISIMNSALSLYITKKTDSIIEGVNLATKLIKDGIVEQKFEQIKREKVKIFWYGSSYERSSKRLYLRNDEAKECRRKTSFRDF